MPLLYTKKRERFVNADELHEFLKNMPEGTTFHVAVYAYDTAKEHELVGQKALNRQEEAFTKKYAMLSLLRKAPDYPRSLADMCGVAEASEKTVRRYIAELSGKGLITKYRAGKGGKLFFTITEKGMETFDKLEEQP